MKLALEPHYTGLTGGFSVTAASWIVVTLGTGLLCACSSQAALPDAETLDSQTGTTVIRMPKPVELVTEQPRGAQADPFAYLAPFETNRMGERTLFLWVSAPQDVGGTLERPQVLCDGQPLTLIPHTEPITQIGLSRSPYTVPAPWSAQWYFRLPEDSFSCLTRASRLSIETQGAEDRKERFSAEAAALGGLASFISLRQ
jgi:hypothetical protein